MLMDLHSLTSALGPPPLPSCPGLLGGPPASASAGYPALAWTAASSMSGHAGQEVADLMHLYSAYIVRGGLVMHGSSCDSHGARSDGTVDMCSHCPKPWGETVLPF